MIEKMTVYEDKFTVEFKSDVTVGCRNINRAEWFFVSYFIQYLIKPEKFNDTS